MKGNPDIAVIINRGAALKILVVVFDDVDANFEGYRIQMAGRRGRRSN
jgi:hypothetical protein